MFLMKMIGGNGANPDGCAKEQPLKIRRAADIIGLNVEQRLSEAFSEMQCSV